MAKQFPVANKVRELREQLQLTQGELGDAVGVTRQTVAAIEQRRYSPSLETAFRIAQVFGVGVEKVFWWEEGK